MSLLSISLLLTIILPQFSFLKKKNKNKYEIILFKLDVGGQVKNILPVARHG